MSFVTICNTSASGSLHIVTFKPEPAPGYSVSRVVRIQEDAEAIALRYGPSVSEGIRVMERLLRQHERRGVDPEAIRDIIREELEALVRY